MKEENEIFETWVKFHIDLALEESTEDALHVLKMVLNQVKNDKPLKGALKEYFVAALENIVTGSNPNAEFHLVGIQGSERGGVHRRYAIARIFRTLKNQGKSSNEIIEELHSLGYRIQLRRAQEIHKEFKEILDIESNLEE